ncbi:MAG: trigger factor [Oscillospiraceae bacterium]|nr:trigger factor [Oscillospiraceae bacterium]
MKATLIERIDSLAKFSIDFPAEEFENAQIEVYRNTRNKFTVAGFRKGKAPRKLIENYYGEDVFFEDAVKRLMGRGYTEALVELGLDPIDDPEFDFSNLSKDSGFTATVSVEVAPQIELKEYKGLEVEKPDNKISEMDVDDEIERVRKRNARLITANRAAVIDDTLIMDFAGFINDEQFEGGSGEMLTLKLGSGSFIPGFEEQLVGAKSGDEVDVKVTFPEKYHAESLAGKDAVFHVKVHEVKAEELPIVDDEFAQDASEYDTLDEWKDDIRERLDKAAAAKNEADLKEAVLEKLYEAHDVQAPDLLVKREIDYEIELISHRLRSESFTLEGYLKHNNMSENELREKIRAGAEKKIKIRLLIQAVAEAENIQAAEEEIEKEIADIAAGYGQKAETFKKSLKTEQLLVIVDDIRNRKAVEFLVDNADVYDREQDTEYTEDSE